MWQWFDESGAPGGRIVPLCTTFHAGSRAALG